MIKPILLILCGYPYAGKTTLARALETELGFRRITVDDIIVELGFPLGKELAEKTWALIYAEAEKRLIAALSSGFSVIFDATNGHQNYRDHLRSIAQPFVEKTLVVFVAAEIDLIRARELHLANRHKAVGVEATIRDFQNPTDDELSVTIRADASYLDVLRSIQEKLLS